MGYYSHHTRSTFVPPGAVESGAPITAFVIGPSQLVPSKNTLQGNYHVHAQHVHALEVCAVGIRKRACTGTDRTCPETSWPCAPPHKHTSRLYDAVNSPPLPLASYFLRRPDWPWKATQDAATKLDVEGVCKVPVSGKHALDTPPRGRH